MASFMDILLSIIFGGALLLIILTATTIISENAATTYGDRLVQESLLAISQRVEGEFRNMGFGVPDTQRAIVLAESTRVKFRIDLPPFGSVDTLTYYLGPTAELSSTSNEQDRYLYRQVGSQPPEPVGVVTRFHLDYINSEFETLPLPITSDSVQRTIQEVEITLEVQNPEAQFRAVDSVAAGERNALYSSALWKQTRLAIQNLDR
jgi:hypothetical protein